MELNLNLFLYLNNFAFLFPWLDTAIIFCAIYLGNILIIGSILFLLFHHDHKYVDSTKIRSVFRQRLKEIALVFLSAILAWALTKGLKELFSSPRPFISIEELKLLFQYGGHDSFPSGHATFFSALAVSLYRYHRGIGIIFIVGALVIGTARVMAGIHYPIDILVGYILGGIVSFIVYSMLLKLSNRYRTRFEQIITKYRF